MTLLPIPYRTMPIIRGTNPQAALDTLLALADAGFTTAEVSLTTANALGVLKRATGRTGLIVGAGTITTPREADAAVEAGARFLVTPGLTRALVDAPRPPVPVFAGAQTPSEIMTALDYGAEAVKLFPASVGGVAYLKALRDPFPHVRFVPVGGVDLATGIDYLAVGAVALGVGGPLVGDAASGGDLHALQERAAAWRRGMDGAVPA